MLQVGARRNGTPRAKSHEPEIMAAFGGIGLCAHHFNEDPFGFLQPSGVHFRLPFSQTLPVEANGPEDTGN